MSRNRSKKVNEKKGSRQVYLDVLKFLPRTQPLSIFMHHFFDGINSHLKDISIDEFTSQLTSLIKTQQPRKIGVEGWHEVKDIVTKYPEKFETMVAKLKIVLTLPLPETCNIDFKFDGLSPEWEKKFTNLITVATAELGMVYVPNPVPKFVLSTPQFIPAEEPRIDHKFKMFDNLISAPGNDTYIKELWSANPYLTEVIRKQNKLNALRIFLLMYQNIEDMGLFQKYVCVVPYKLILDFIELVNNSQSIPVINPIAKTLKLNVLYAVKIKKENEMKTESKLLSPSPELETSQPVVDRGSKRPHKFEKASEDIESPFKRRRIDKVPSGFFDEPSAQVTTGRPKQEIATRDESYNPLTSDAFNPGSIATASTPLPTPVAVTPVIWNPTRDIIIDQTRPLTPFTQEILYDPVLNLFPVLDGFGDGFGDDFGDSFGDSFGKHRFDPWPDSPKY